MSWIFEPECRPKCRSKRHALEFHSAISKGCLKEVKAYSRLCHNVTQVKDTVGRSALHVAAACGKADIVEWLLADKHGDLTDKDSESGWTTLHRAVFYGQLPVIRQLIQHGSDLYSRDHEGLSALDILMKDRLKQLTYSVKEPNEVYVWGDNSNFNLGHASGQSRSSPEVIDEFKRTCISVKNMVLCKYHTVFLTQSGQIYTCGHGHGGRLGHESELTCVVPRLVKTMSHETCVQIAAARDHTVMLMESGSVYSCGLNDFHQLGQIPPPDKSIKPRQMSLKVVKGKTILGVCVGRFHTVVYTAETVYTFGLNAGQLGHQKGEKIQSQPRMVSVLSHKDIVITSVTCSDAATVCLTNNGEIFVLHEYLCRRIASKWVNVSKMLVYGGKLDHKMDADMLREKGGSELHIALLNTSGRLFIWRESSPTLHRCHWAIKRQLLIVDFVFSHATVAFITGAGEGFMGHWSNKKHAPPKEQIIHKKIVDTFEKSSLIDLMRDDVEIVQVTRIANIHRGTKISADWKNSNYMVLQALPNGCLSDLPFISASEMGEHFQRLFEEADEYDAIHDVIVLTGNHSWPCHKYILVSRCDFFRNKVAKLSVTDESDDEDFFDEKPIFEVPDVPAEILEQVLKYIYTDTCDLLKVGSKFDPVIMKGEGQEKGQGDMDIEVKKDNSDLLISENLAKMSAFEVHQKKKKLAKSGHKENSEQPVPGKNPVRYLQEVARQLGVKGLSKKLDAVKYVNGAVHSTGKVVAPARVRFDRSKLSELCDVSIEAEDGTSIKCHKCVLVARLDYFHSMLGSGWIETSDTTSLTLPVPGDVLSILLDYIYNGDSIVITDCQHAELLCNILVVADQLLVTRLKEMCEVALANLITFRNVGEILEFATVYNATQLRGTCQQFISLNLGALLEGRYLDVLSDDTIHELRDYYRNSLSCMSRRMITPYSSAPTKDFLETLASKYQDDPTTPSTDSSSRKNKPKKRRSRTKSISDETEKGRPTDVPRRGERQISVCSDISVEENMEEEQGHPEEKPTVDTPVTKDSKNIAPVSSASIPVPGREKTNPWGYSSPPTPQGAWGPSSPDPPVSPLSPTGGVSLRDIMTQQQSNRKSKQSVEKRASGGKVTWKDVKKQQNKAAQNVAAQKETTSTPKQKQNTCPWGSVNKVVQSFRELMLAEKGPVGGNSLNTTITAAATKPAARSTPAASGTAAGAGEHLSWGLPTSKQSRPRPPVPMEPLSVPSPPVNPWVMTEASSPPSSGVSFSDILRDEQERKRTLDYASKKPLNLIQIEEQAIQELLLHYKAADKVDEHITVERVPQARAAPLWSVSKQRGTPTKF